MRGEYVILHPVTKEVIEVLPNSLIGEGHEQLVNALFNKDLVVDWSFVFGAFSEVPAYLDSAQAQYTTEPTIGVNGYGRVTLNPTGWTIVVASETVYAESPDITFTGSGGDFDLTFNRLFMHFRVENPAATFTEYLASVGSALAAAKQVVDTEVYVLRYRLYFS